MNFLFNLPLADPVDGVIFFAILGIIALVVAWRKKIWPFAVALLVVLITWFFMRTWQVPLYLFAAGIVPVAAFLSKPRRIMISLGLVAALATAGLANMEYQTYPNVGSLDPREVAKDMDYKEFSSLKSSDQAALVHVDIPGKKSGFQARQAIAYVPPAYWKGAKLPVMVLLHGNPGGPDQWFGSGEAAETADQFQATNDGMSPIVIAVDATGSETANPICADSDVAKVMTYLAEDVPAGIKSRFRVDKDQSHWTVAGLSYGGTCAMQIATNHPDAFGSVINISGEAQPTIGDHAATVQKFFGGDETRYNAQDPVHLLQKNKYPNLEAVFIAGVDDSASVAALKNQSELAAKAGIKNYYGTRPGGHSFQLWRPSMPEAFAWAAGRGGIEVKVDPFDGIEEKDVRS
ncbi:alpha/beta hydrolase [Corynebacterium flavescens]|uniref:alpha/beta hydrolase n=1 Tax=Corynebacterium flavescens TaxID=28028 RepID=UPI0026490093|nr:alpha/beta fold hydrolase [Corynebacterium flavescens]MDN6474194.1 alpha/beta fold hydrolase [Corynebacterium flavescens]